MAISRNRRGNRSGRGSPEPLWLEAIAVEAITKGQVVYVDSLAVTGTSFSTTSIGQDIVRRVGVATNATKRKAHGTLYVALMSATTADPKLKIAPIGLFNNLDTSGAAAGDAVYLSTAGAPTLTATGFVRRIGEVIGVGVSGTGTWNFAPADMVIGARTPLIGTATITNGTGAVTVTNPFGIGASITGAPAFAQFQADDGTVAINAVAWSTNDLVISATANTTADRVVAYQIWV